MAKTGRPKTVTSWKSLQLWPHQVEAINMVRRFQDSGSSGSALVRMPPGSGKTGIMAVLAQVFDDKADVLVVAPWAQLTHQIAKEIGGAFWGKLGAQPRKQLKPTVTFRPSHLPGLLKAHAKEPTVFVCTNQTLERLFATNLRVYRALAERVRLVLVDEGHREPAPEWAKAVRGLGRPTVLFTATPYRNDSRLFNIDDSFVYRLPHSKALAGHFIRQVAFHEIEFGDTPKSFVDKLLAFYEGPFLRSKPAGPSAIRVIVRCDTQVDVREVAALLRARKQSVVAVHENFERSDEAQTYRRVPDPSENDAVFWVHQFKLIEGVDDPSFGLLAIYQRLSNARALVQQVGRVIRNPTRTAGRTASVFSHPRQKQARMWQAYLRYEDRLVSGAKEVASIGIARELLRVQDKYAYLDGNFREPFNPRVSDFYEHIRYPLTTSVYTVVKGFQRQALDPPRMALIHAKHGDGGSLSAKAFHVICSQAIKNLGVLTPQWEGPSENVTRWNGAWSGPQIGRVARRIRVNRPNKGATDLWLQIRQLVRQPSTVREVWIVMGDGMSRSAFEAERNREKPRASST